MMLTLWNLLSFLLFLSNVNGQFHCGRSMDTFQCLNGGTCDKDTGKCTCAPEYVGEGCSVSKDAVCPDGADNPCLNGQICYDTDKCLCAHEYYGATCELERVKTVCKGARFNISIALPMDFEGQVFLKNSDECVFKEGKEENGLKHYEYQMNLNESTACNNALNVTEQGDDIIYSTDSLVTYSPPIILPTDVTLNVRCVHRASDVEMGSMLGAVDLDEKEHLQNQEKEHVYAPVEFRFLNAKDEKVQKLAVGEKFKLMFYLDDNSVYTSLLLINCSANNSNPGDPKVFKFLEDGCPTRPGKNVIYNDAGQAQYTYTSPVGTEHTAVEIMLKAFRFIKTDRVSFSCSVRICKKGDETHCEIPDCAAGERAVAVPSSNGGAKAAANENTANAATNENTEGAATNENPADAATNENPVVAATNENTAETATEVAAKRRRRKRSTSGTEERIISGIIKVIEPGQAKSTKEPSKDFTEKAEEKCLAPIENTVVIILLTALVITLVFICAILAKTVFTIKKKVYSKDNQANGPSVFIPRPKIV